MVLAATGYAFYWTCFHTTMAQLGDHEARGAQVSAVQLTYALNTIVGPVVGGAAFVWLGPKAAFFIAAVPQVLAALPLIATPELTVPKPGVAHPEIRRFASRIYFCDGFMASATAFTCRWRCSSALARISKLTASPWRSRP